MGSFNVIVCAHLLHKHGPVFWGPNSALYISGLNLIAETKHKVVGGFRSDTVKPPPNFIGWKQIEAHQFATGFPGFAVLSIINAWSYGPNVVVE